MPYVRRGMPGRAPASEALSAASGSRSRALRAETGVQRLEELDENHCS